MDKERYFKVFSKRYSEGIDILGIKLIPLAISEELRLKFKLENPNDLPYTKSSLIGFLKQEIGEFTSKDWRRFRCQSRITNVFMAIHSE